MHDTILQHALAILASFPIFSLSATLAYTQDMTVKEVCAELGISRETVRKLIKNGKLRAVRHFNGRLQFNDCDVRDLKTKGAGRYA